MPTGMSLSGEVTGSPFGPKRVLEFPAIPGVTINVFAENPDFVSPWVG